MYVRDLISKLEEADKNALVVLPGSDHSYRLVYNATPNEAQIDNGHISEFYEDYGIDNVTASIIKVFVIE